MFGLQTNAKGQVTVKSSVLKQMEDIKEETGLTCCICREGYRCQPQKVSSSFALLCTVLLLLEFLLFLSLRQTVFMGICCCCFFIPCKQTFCSLVY